ncbi:hypothetical protein HK103_001417 [Boothiomyces macroporosus]|uniref:Uncharacterized protein n=1 Tax=Boothiomyces macroporosus TaxID=261099 RepID=A0AAD5Y0K6_9FUNG|nr:hypothetical protein HK103_001417 [Boothiomyces macroporosus]
MTQKQQINPGLLSFITISWLTPLLRQAKKKPLTKDDLYELNDNDKSENLSKQFEPFVVEYKLFREGKGPEPSLFKAIARIMSKELFFSVICLSITIVLGLYIPKALEQLVNSIDPFNRDSLWVDNGVALAFIYFGMLLFNTIFTSLNTNINRKISQKSNAIMTGAIYQKSFTLASKSKTKFNEGRIMNMVNEDVQSVTNGLLIIGQVVLLPIQFGLNIYFIWGLVGSAFLAGAGILGAIALSTAVLLPFLNKYISRMIKANDARLAAMRELFYGIKIIKLQALEGYFRDKVAKFRGEQIINLKKFISILCIFLALLFSSQTLLTVATFAVYAVRDGNKMNPGRIFAALSYIGAIVGSLNQLSFTLSSVVRVRKSIMRIHEFLLADELDEKEASLFNSTVDPALPAIKLDNVTWKWEDLDVIKEEIRKEKERKGGPPKEAKKDKTTEKKESDAPKKSMFSFGKKKAEEKPSDEKEEKEERKPPFHLQNISMEIPTGKLVGVVGQIGSGKSSFFSGLINESERLEGDLKINGSIAFCSQQPWILTGTIEKNIVFDQEVDEKKLENAIDVSGLRDDLKLFKDGIKTEIGENGINLSGGQKTRLSLARAIYVNADIYLLDDPLAALDAQVGKHVFENAIKTQLASKTVFLATHQLHYMQQVDHILVFHEGKIVEAGPFDELIHKENGKLKEMLESYKFDEKQDDEEKKIIEKQIASGGAVVDETQDFIEAEDKRQGQVKASVYFTYLKGYKGLGKPIAIAIAVCVTIAAQTLNPWWLSRWTTEASTPGFHETTLYLLVYTGIGLANMVANILFISLFFFAAITASCYFHDMALEGLLRAPMAFYDRNPIGRIINRMSTDVEALDNGIVGVFMTTIFTVASIVSSTVLIVQGSWYLLIGIVVLPILFIGLFNMYKPANIELKRLTSTGKSPLDSHISETLTGLATIRAYRVEQSFIAKQRLLMDDSQAPSYIFQSAQIWFQLRVSVLTSFLSLAMALIAVLTTSSSIAFASRVALSLSSATQIAESITALLSTLATAEAEMNAVERMDYYGNNLPREDETVKPADPDATQWPKEGKIEIKDLELRYPNRPDSVIIKGISALIKPGEKVGVVGRTGSGKSTLLTAFFRIMEPSQGTIIIDGQDIQKLGLATLRSRIQIISQEPVLFDGTFRSNLDHTGEHTDDELWKALEYSGLKDYVSELPEKLDASITTNGENLSVGQRQLVCLSRSILQKPKILMMDEATSSIDGDSDKLVQQAIQNHFGSTTVISIAHRLNTIAGFDRVIVLDKGKIAEFDTPHALLQDKESIFSQMTDASGQANAQLIRELAQQHYESTH